MLEWAQAIATPSSLLFHVECWVYAQSLAWSLGRVWVLGCALFAPRGEAVLLRNTKRPNSA